MITLTHRFTLLYSSGSYPAGTVIETYYNDVDDDIDVYIDDVLETSGPTLQSLGSDYSQQDFTYHFCDSGSLVSFRKISDYIDFFPYVQKGTIPGHPSCTGAVCDIVINSLIADYDTGLNDGVIEVYADSSYPPITYSINGSGYGSSNVFTNLTAGEYTIQVADQNHCIVQKSINVQLSPGYVEIFNSQYNSIDNHYEISIQKLNFEGESIEVCLSNEAVLSYTSQSFTSIYDYSVQPSNLVVSLLNDVPDQYHTLFTTKHKNVRVIFKENDIEIWRGYILASEFGEPYESGKYPTQITFVDGLKLLDRVQTSTRPFSMDNSLIRVICDFLSITGLDLPVNVSLEVYAQGMDASISTLSQTFVEYESISLRDYDCFEALNMLLLPFGCVLLQQDGAWWIVRHDKRGSDFNYYSFDSQGRSLDIEGDYAPLKLWNCPTNVDRVTQISNSVSLESLGGFGSIIMSNEFAVRESLIKNYEFEIAGSGTQLFKDWNFVLNGSTVSLSSEKTGSGISASFDFQTYISSTENYQTMESRSAYIVSSDTPIRYGPGDRLRFSFQYGFDRIDTSIPFSIIRAEVKLGDKWLNDVGDWETSQYILRFYQAPKGEFQTAKITVNLPDVTAITEEMVSVRLYAYAANEPEVDSVSDLGDILTADLQTGYKIDVDVNTGVPSDPRYIQYYELINGLAGDITPDDVEPVDYGVTNGSRFWKLQKKVRFSKGSSTGRYLAVFNTKYLVDTIEIDYLPAGSFIAGNPVYRVPRDGALRGEGNEQVGGFGSYRPGGELIAIQTSTFIIDSKNPEDYNAGLQFGALPMNFETNDFQTPNDIYSYFSGFKLSNGTYAKAWGRKGLSESVRLQILYINTLIEQHSTQTIRIVGHFTTREKGFSSFNEGLILKPLDCLYNTYDGKYYIVVAYSLISRAGQYYLELIELKAGGSAGVFAEHTVLEHDEGHS